MNRDEIQTCLAGYRHDLYGGRGPGIPEEARLRNTSLRPEIAGVPTGALREEVHLRALRARGEGHQAELQRDWAAAQFQAALPDGDTTAGALLPTVREEQPRHPVRRRLLGTLGVTAIALLKVSRRRRAS